jgi:hypothetical protein
MCKLHHICGVFVRRKGFFRCIHQGVVTETNTSIADIDNEAVTLNGKKCLLTVPIRPRPGLSMRSCRD